MFFLNPGKVTFGSVVWPGVSSVAVGRGAARSVVEFGDAGPHAVLADVPAQRVVVTVVQDLLGDDLDSPVPGDAGTLEFETAPNRGDAGRKRVTASVVVLSVSYRVAGRNGSARTVEFVAVSGDGVTDPVAVVDVQAEG